MPPFIGERGERLSFHDLRHQAITELAEAGAADATIEALAGHISREMLEHCSHVRMAAKVDQSVPGAPQGRPTLLFAQRHHRIHAHGPARRHVACDRCNRDQYD